MHLLGAASASDFAVDEFNILQSAVCLAGAAIALIFVWLINSRGDKVAAGRITLRQVAVFVVVGLGCLHFLAPFSTLNGDGRVHQERAWFIAQTLRHAALPDWTFYWHGGDVVNELYGPIYYIFAAALMTALGLTTKWVFAGIALTCDLLCAYLISKGLSKRYGLFAASVAAFCFLLSPARAASYWFDGRPHVIIIEMIMALYAAFFSSARSKANAWFLGAALGVAAALCVEFHLQYGGMAAILLFAFTGLVLAVEFLSRPSPPGFLRAAVIVGIGLALFTLTSAQHYLYYMQVKGDLNTSNDPNFQLFALRRDWLANFKAETLWTLWNTSWNVHYVGLSALVLCGFAVVAGSKGDPAARISGAMAVGLFILTPFLGRAGVFVPVFFVPAVAAATRAIEQRFHDRPRLGLSLSAGTLTTIFLSILIVDLLPSNFALPYRPTSGERKVLAANLAKPPASPGRVMVMSPSGGVSDVTADVVKRTLPIAPSLFGPTVQLGTKMVGLSTFVARNGWVDFSRNRQLSAEDQADLAFLDVSEALLLDKDRLMGRVAIAGARPAWRVTSYACASSGSPVSRLDFDGLRAMSDGSATVVGAEAGLPQVDAAAGTVGGVALACDPGGHLAAWPTSIESAPFTVTAPIYDAGYSTATFSLTTSRPGLFVLPFGYYRDLVVRINGAAASISRTADWMTVISVPAGASHLSLSGQPKGVMQRRIGDLALFAGLAGLVAAWFWTPWTRRKLAAEG